MGLKHRADRHGRSRRAHFRLERHLKIRKKRELAEVSVSVILKASQRGGGMRVVRCGE